MFHVCDSTLAATAVSDVGTVDAKCIHAQPPLFPWYACCFCLTCAAGPNAGVCSSIHCVGQHLLYKEGVIRDNGCRQMGMHLLSDLQYCVHFAIIVLRKHLQNANLPCHTMLPECNSCLQVKTSIVLCCAKVETVFRRMFACLYMDEMSMCCSQCANKNKHKHLSQVAELSVLAPFIPKTLVSTPQALALKETKKVRLRKSDIMSKTK